MTPDAFRESIRDATDPQRKTALVQQTDKPDALGLARFRIVCHTPGCPCAVIFWTGAEERIVRELLGAGYMIQVGGVGLQPAEMERAP